MAELDLEELERVARAATQGSWSAHITNRRSPEVYTDAPPPNTPNPLICRGVLRKADARHIEAFDPPTVLSLLQALKEAREALERIRSECGVSYEEFAVLGLGFALANARRATEIARMTLTKLGGQEP